MRLLDCTMPPASKRAAFVLKAVALYPLKHIAACLQRSHGLVVLAVASPLGFAELNSCARGVEPLASGWMQTFRDDSAGPAATPSARGFAQFPAALNAMRTAAEYLGTPATVPAASGAQQDALAKLDATLTQLQQQCQQCMGGKRSKAGDQKPPNKPSSKRGGANPDGAAVGSGQGAAGEAAAGAAVQVRDLWGHLPQRQRDAMLQPLREEFLPQYAEDIEAYFRELAEPSAASENGQ